MRFCEFRSENISRFNKMCDPSFNNLPSEIVLEIFSNLDYRDLINCGYLNRRLCELSNHPARWKVLCQKYWLETDCPKDLTWKELFISYYKNMGKYIDCYASVKTSWNKIMAFMLKNCPAIYQTVKDGVSEEELDIAEMILKLKLPNDFRCSYRIHNGQKLSSLGLMGSMSIHTHYRSESLLDVSTILSGYQDRDGLQGCIPVTFCLHSGITQYLAVTDQDGYDANTVFYLSQSDLNDRSLYIIPFVNGRDSPDAFITANSFKEWLSSYAAYLERDDFTVLHSQPYRFIHDPACKATTGHITVSVATCFMPELSKVIPPTFFHTYRITMSMPAETPQSETYQLETRHWIVTDEYGIEKKVSGNGVVGQYPIICPGTSFSWISCTTFSTTYGNMKGHFVLRNIITGDRIKVQCPVFHVKCLPYITAESRASNKEAKRLKQIYGELKMDVAGGGAR